MTDVVFQISDASSARETAIATSENPSRIPAAPKIGPIEHGLTSPIGARVRSASP